MIKNIITLLFILLITSNLLSQNLILNPSFENTNYLYDSLRRHKVDFGKKSDILNWFIPVYFEHSANQNQVYYFTSNDSKLLKNKNEFTNSEEMFYNNKGFVLIRTEACIGGGVIQQKLSKKIKKGRYCLGFKYKRQWFQEITGDNLEFAFSKSDLRKYFNGGCLDIPSSLVKFTFNDSVNNCFDIPWQQKRVIIELSGDEKFVTIGSLKHSVSLLEKTNNYYIDDLELFFLGDDRTNCICDSINKNISSTLNREFPINERIDSDSLAIYSPINRLRSGPPLHTPATKAYLLNIIAFMQRNPNVKIKFIEYDRAGIINKYPPSSYTSYKNFMNFYGISKNRIVSEWGLFDSPKDIYFGYNLDFIKMSILFYE